MQDDVKQVEENCTHLEEKLQGLLRRQEALLPQVDYADYTFISLGVSFVVCIRSSHCYVMWGISWLEGHLVPKPD